jgi:hypothetical protein
MWCPASPRCRRSIPWRPESTELCTPWVRRYQIPGAAKRPNIRPLSFSRTRSEAGRSAGIDLEQSFSPWERTLGMRLVCWSNHLICCGFSKIGHRIGPSTRIDLKQSFDPCECTLALRSACQNNNVICWKLYFLKFAGISVYLLEINM